MSIPPELKMILDVVKKKVEETADPTKLPTSRLVGEVAFWTGMAPQYAMQLEELHAAQAEARPGSMDHTAFAEVIGLFEQLPAVGERCMAELDRRFPVPSLKVWLLFEQGEYGFHEVYATEPAARRAFAKRVLETTRYVPSEEAKQVWAKYERADLASLQTVAAVLAWYWGQDWYDPDSKSNGFELKELEVLS